MAGRRPGPCAGIWRLLMSSGGRDSVKTRRCPFDPVLLGFQLLRERFKNVFLLSLDGVCSCSSLALSSDYFSCSSPGALLNEVCFALCWEIHPPPPPPQFHLACGEDAQLLMGPWFCTFKMHGCVPLFHLRLSAVFCTKAAST